MTYRDLTIHQRINVKSWVRHDIPIPCVYHSVLFYDTGLPRQLADRKQRGVIASQGDNR